MIKEYVIKKLLDAAIDKAKKFLKVTYGEFLTTKEQLEESIRIHLQAVENWSAQVSFEDLNEPKPITGVFIELDLFIRPRRIRQAREVIKNIPLRSIFDYSPNHPILLGHPGAGKTTSMKYLCQLLLHDDEFYSDRLSFPILIRFRDLPSHEHTHEGSLLIDEIYSILGLKMGLSSDSRTNLSERKKIKEKLVISVLEDFKVLLILEGVDELRNVKNTEQVINEIRNLALQLTNSIMIVTSRSGDFAYSIDNTIQYEICPLSVTQIEQFAMKWLDDEQEASEFLEKIFLSPFADTTIRPLTLAYICAIYERIGKIPDKPKSIYKKVVNLLLEEWDRQRSVRRYSRYANFEIDRKFDFICRLAYVLTTSLTATVFSEDDLRVAYLQMFQDYDLMRHEVNSVVAELESHTGLFFESGYLKYEFAHKSLQEYLTAEYIVKLPSIPEDKAVLLKLPNELAIAVCISSSTSDYFSELMLNVLRGVKLSEDFCRTFVNRLLLEKPDFNCTFNISLSLVMLYSNYVESMILRNDQNCGFGFDSSTQDFERLVESVLNKNSSFIPNTYYDKKRTISHDTGTIYLMVRKSEFDTALSDRVEVYPRTLYMSASFLG